MTDYYPLVKRAVEGLDKGSGEGRRALYERARTALLAQLRGLNPPLSESEITRERLALEEAVRKVEAEAARQMRETAMAETASMRSSELPAPSRPAANDIPPRRDDVPPPPPRRTEPRAQPPEAQPARSAGRLKFKLDRPPLTTEGLKGFRDVVAEAEGLGEATSQAAKSARETFAAMPDDVPKPDRLEPGIDQEPPRAQIREKKPSLRSRMSLADTPLAKSLERARTPQPSEPEQAEPPEPPPPPTPSSYSETEAPEPRRRPPGPAPRRGNGFDGEDTISPARKGMIAAIGALAVIVILASTAFWQRDRISGWFGAGRGTPQAQRDASQSRPKIADRVGQEAQDAARTPQTTVTPTRPSAQAPAVAQRVVLYEEDPTNPEGNRLVGSALWRTETISPGPGLSPELAVRADVEVPERRLAMTLSIRRNTDTALPASHTVEIMFNLPSEFAFGGIQNVPGLLVKESEQTRGAPLSGLAVKVTNNFFLIGLSAADADKARNLQLLKERAWFDIPVVYNNGRRAILAIEKGNPGERVFNEAFAAWKQ
jgi:hypothetical protein